MTDTERLTLLEKDPEAGMEALIEQYSGLLWKVASGYLQNPEDIRDSVSEAFSDFYLHRTNFDPLKGTLSSYLAVIVRRNALHRYREGLRQMELREAAATIQPDAFERLEQKTELEGALSQLDPEDERILRMKYYQGMSAKEIAASLDLPYETVKKRQQRSLKKLRKILTIGLIVTLLVTLAACAVLVLQHLGVFPGYGLSTSAEEKLFSLPESFSFQEGGYEVHVADAWWQDGTLGVRILIYGEGDIYMYPWNWSIEGLTDVAEAGGIWMRDAPPEPGLARLLFSGGLPEGTGDTLELTLFCGGNAHPMTLRASSSSTLAEAGFYSYTEEDGGILAIPRLENGELVVSIYPLNLGEFVTIPTLTNGFTSGYGTLPQPVTVTAPDGTVMQGKPEHISYFMEEPYADWHFGPAEPGEYTLNIPYVAQRPAQDEFIYFDLPLNGGIEDLKIELPGGTLTFGPLVPVDGPLMQSDGELFIGEFPNYRWWEVQYFWTPDNPERVLVSPSLHAQDSGYQDMDEVYHGTLVQDINTLITDEASGKRFYLQDTWRIGTDSEEDFLPMQIHLDWSFFHWEHPFSIPMTVEAEPDVVSYTQTEGELGVTAVPRRNAETGVTVSLWPVSGEDGPQVSPEMTYITVPISGMQEEPVTLIAADGTSYTGSFQMSRKRTFSNWNFGDIPAGAYTLHIPYLFVSEKLKWYKTPIPVPAQGEIQPGEFVELACGCGIQISDITGLGPMEDYPLLEYNADGELVPVSDLKVIINDIGVDQYEEEEPPFQFKLSLTPISGEEFTLAYAGLGAGDAMPSVLEYACVPSYDWEQEFPLNGALLRCLPELEQVILTFRDPVYRWNRCFDIPVTIP